MRRPPEHWTSYLLYSLRCQFFRRKFPYPAGKLDLVSGDLPSVFDADHHVRKLHVFNEHGVAPPAAAQPPVGAAGKPVYWTRCSRTLIVESITYGEKIGRVDRLAEPRPRHGLLALLTGDKRKSQDGAKTRRAPAQVG